MPTNEFVGVSFCNAELPPSVVECVDKVEIFCDDTLEDTLEATLEGCFFPVGCKGGDGERDKVPGINLFIVLGELASSEDRVGLRPAGI